MTILMGTNVTLVCKAPGSMTIFWEINGRKLDDEITRAVFDAQGIFQGPTHHENGNTFSSVFAHASLENNGTLFRCQAFQGSSAFPNTSDSVALIVHGE